MMGIAEEDLFPHEAIEKFKSTNHLELKTPISPLVGHGLLCLYNEYKLT